MTTFNAALDQLAGKDIYVSCEPDVLDFTSKRSGKLVIRAESITIEVPLVDVTEIKLREYLGYLQLFIGGEKTIVFAWNWKNFLSFTKAKTGVDFKLTGHLFDLCLLESYFGEKNVAPTSFQEAKNRLAILTKKTNWKTVYNVYQAVYLPLIAAIPHLETCGLSHHDKRAMVYSHYELDGQINGRMKAINLFQHSFNPHSLTPEEKVNLKLPGWNYQFMAFDFKCMEVAVLQWLSKDEYMGEILNSGRDFYEAIWEALVPVPCNETHRKTCKSFFLPVIYGLGVEGLAKKIDWPVSHAKNLIDKMYKTMPAAMLWIKNQQSKLENGKAYDVYCRCREFDSSYLVRNFVVQSPASLICLHKLGCLVEALKDWAKVCMSIHDGYVIITEKKDLRKTYETAKQILESENELYAGLKLKTVCSSGASLNELKSFFV